MSFKKLKLSISIILLLIISVLLFVLVVNLIVVNSSSDNILTEDTINDKYDSIVVLGAGIKANKTPSDMLADRLNMAINLYKNGVSDHIVLSGDCSGDYYDEVSVMFNYCVELGVPETSLIRDNSGYSTYESIYNVTNQLGHKRFVVVTQKYHLHRAVYIAEKMEADAIGVASDARAYRGQIFRSVREYAARIKDFIKVEISK